MAKAIRGKDGKFRGSVGEGRSAAPTAGRSLPSSPSRAGDVADVPASVAAWDRYRVFKDEQPGVKVAAPDGTGFDLNVQTCRYAADRGWRGHVPSEVSRHSVGGYVAAEAAADEAVEWLNGRAPEGHVYSFDDDANSLVLRRADG